MKILLIGNGAREHAIAKLLKKNPEVELFTFASAKNPGIFKLSSDYHVGDYLNPASVVEYAKKVGVEIAVVGPEAPLGQGVVDALEQVGIGCMGPVQELAKLETSKSFTRNLLIDYNIPANPKFKAFKTTDDMREFMEEIGPFVVKPDGLTGGKGVRVMGDHFQIAEEGYNYAKEVLQTHPRVLIEEKLIGQEFCLQSFCDGEHIIHMPIVQDNKRAFTDDKGPNTGGMGSFSFADHNMPFMTEKDFEEAKNINEQVLKALKDKTGVGYKGIMYGNFIAVKDGVRIIEYNARFGDPEAMNVLPLLKSDLATICQAIVKGNLHEVDVEFEHKATVCKYAVPEGYPDDPVKDVKIDLSEVDENRVELFHAAVDEREDGVYMTGSRAVAITGIDEDMNVAEQKAEEEIKKIKGEVFHREDIGKSELIEKRVKMMNSVRNA